MSRKELSPRLWFWGNILSMFAIGILFVIAVYLSLIFYTHHGNMVQVPNVIGKDYKEAKELLEEAGLRVQVTDTGYMTKLAPDLILDQHIPAGTTVKFNRPIFLTINSDHPRLVPLPEIIDGSARSAEIKLKAMGFKVGKRKLVPGDDDLVMSVEIDGKKVSTGERVSIEASVVLIVGNGNVVERYNGNDSLDWALELEIQETEAKKEAEKRALKDRLHAEQKGNADESADGDGANAVVTPAAPVQHSVPVEKVTAPRRSEDLFK